MRVGLLTVYMQEPSMPAHDPEYILSWAVSFYIYVYICQGAVNGCGGEHHSVVE